MAEKATDTTESAAGESTADSTATDTAKESGGTAAPEVRDPVKLLHAYEAEKAKRKEQDDALRAIRSEFDAFKAKADGKEAEHAAAIEAQRVKDEALKAANERILKSEVRATATGKLQDPQDALRYLNLSEFEVDSEGNVDGNAVAAAVDRLIKEKPYLAAQGGSRFQGSADGGARKDATQLPQLSRDDLKGKAPEWISQAKAAGQLNDLLGIK